MFVRNITYPPVRWVGTIPQRRLHTACIARQCITCRMHTTFVLESSRWGRSSFTQKLSNSKKIGSYHDSKTRLRKRYWPEPPCNSITFRFHRLQEREGRWGGGEMSIDTASSINKSKRPRTGMRVHGVCAEKNAFTPCRAKHEKWTKQEVLQICEHVWTGIHPHNRYIIIHLRARNTWWRGRVTTTTYLQQCTFRYRFPSAGRAGEDRGWGMVIKPAVHQHNKRHTYRYKHTNEYKAYKGCDVAKLWEALR